MQVKHVWGSFTEAKPEGNGQVGPAPQAPGQALHLCPTSCAHAQAMLKSTLSQFHSTQYLKTTTKRQLDLLFQQHKHTSSLLTHLTSLSIFLQVIYCHWLNWHRTGICGTTHKKFGPGWKCIFWLRVLHLFVCLSIPPRVTYSCNDTTLTYWPIFQMGQHHFLMVNCADFFRGIWEDDNETSVLHLLISAY